MIDRRQAHRVKTRLLLGGGAAYAAGQLAKNSVGAKQLKKNAVTTTKMKKEAVTGAKIKKGTITGTQINLSTLGTVPGAADARTLDGQSANQLTSASRLHCPSGMALSNGVCFEETAKAAVEWNNAADSCDVEQLRLPTLGELNDYEVPRFPGFEAPPAEWTEPMSYSGTQAWANVAAASEKGLSFGSTKTQESYPYRCVTSATNRRASSASNSQPPKAT